jgi:SPP1 gp7 family putative phage head morphogenesis protein
MKTLKPVITKANYYTELEKTINDFFLSILKEIENIITRNITMLNSVDVLQDALNSGRVQYFNGSFQGRFNSRIVKELQKLGAIFDQRTKAYNLAMNKLPYNLVSQIAISSSKFENVHNETLKYLDNLQANNILDNKINELPLHDNYIATLDDVEDEFSKTMDGVVDYYRSDKINENLSREYASNLKLYIRKFTDENILSLRKQVLNNTFQGYRAENLISILKNNYSVSENKAKFLARQETNLLVASFREQRYTDAGINKYKWRIRGFRTRKDHKRLDGKIFLWSEPPVVNRETGERKHPGQDWNCFCTAIPIVEF